MASLDMHSHGEEEAARHLKDIMMDRCLGAIILFFHVVPVSFIPVVFCVVLCLLLCFFCASVFVVWLIVCSADSEKDLFYPIINYALEDLDCSALLLLVLSSSAQTRYDSVLSWLCIPYSCVPRCCPRAVVVLPKQLLIVVLMFF